MIILDARPYGVNKVIMTESITMELPKKEDDFSVKFTVGAEDIKVDFKTVEALKENLHNMTNGIINL